MQAFHWQNSWLIEEVLTGVRACQHASGCNLKQQKKVGSYGKTLNKKHREEAGEAEEGRKADQRDGGGWKGSRRIHC